MDQCMFCNRQQVMVLCVHCGHTLMGRVRRTCNAHPQLIQLMDIGYCPECKMMDLKECSYNATPSRTPKSAARGRINPASPVSPPTPGPTLTITIPNLSGDTQLSPSERIIKYIKSPRPLVSTSASVTPAMLENGLFKISHMASVVTATSPNHDYSPSMPPLRSTQSPKSQIDYSYSKQISTPTKASPVFSPYQPNKMSDPQSPTKARQQKPLGASQQMPYAQSQLRPILPSAQSLTEPRQSQLQNHLSSGFPKSPSKPNHHYMSPQITMSPSQSRVYNGIGRGSPALLKPQVFGIRSRLPSPQSFNGKTVASRMANHLGVLEPQSVTETETW